jgi:hypothetical protein
MRATALTPPAIPPIRAPFGELPELEVLDPPDVGLDPGEVAVGWG